MEEVRRGGKVRKEGDTKYYNTYTLHMNCIVYTTLPVQCTIYLVS